MEASELKLLSFGKGKKKKVDERKERRLEIIISVLFPSTLSLMYIENN